MIGMFPDSANGVPTVDCQPGRRNRNGFGELSVLHIDVAGDLAALLARGTAHRLCRTANRSKEEGAVHPVEINGVDFRTIVINEVGSVHFDFAGAVIAA
jgi:hypothetical protein